MSLRSVAYPFPHINLSLPVRPRIYTCRKCALRNLHISRQCRTDNHYETLGIAPSAPQSDVKKAYYKLSKSTHPDRNPGDKNAAERFAAVSGAYATLGHPDKRARYDKDVMRTRSPAVRQGSHSSSQSGAYGSRPASGLSKRRSPFRGPPPSFYRSGGYGRYGQRAAEAEANAANARQEAGREYREGSAAWNTSTQGGFSPGQGAQRGFDNDVPHFDREGHFRTQETVQGRFAGRRTRMHRDGTEFEGTAGFGGWPAFFVISLVVGTAVVVPAWLFGGSSASRRRDDG